MISSELKYSLSELLQDCREDWCLFALEVLGADLDEEQKDILRSVQRNPKTSVKSGTARGKDFVSAVAAMCFLYLTPGFDEEGKLIDNTKVALTAPTDRQVKNIMMPEVARLHMNMVTNGFGFMAGKLNAYDIKTDYKEWFLTGFKADENKHEAWSGFHAVNTLFVVTEASGISESIFNAIEGNLQGNSRLLIVFNDNNGTGYAAASQKKRGWSKFRLDSLNAPNVLYRSEIEAGIRKAIPGQVDWRWVNDRVNDWCQVIGSSEFKEEEGDFWWENENGRYCYRPNDLFRVKVRGMAPKISSGALVPPEWIEIANKRWRMYKEKGSENLKSLRLGVDVAGMGRDSSAFCFRYGNLLDRFDMIHSGGTANHMEVAGKVKQILNNDRSAQAFIDTIGEGAGVFSRLQEQGVKTAHSVKFSEGAEWEGKDLTDVTEQYTFLNMRAYLYWAVRDWLDPKNKTGAALPPDPELEEELTETQWKFRSDGRIQIEAKEDIKKRIGRSPDKSDAFANTFYPVTENDFDYSQLNAFL
jgi:hypothetical protein